MKNIFFISRGLNGPYKFIIESSKLNFERSSKTTLSYIKYKRKIFNIKCILFILQNILNLNFFSKKKVMFIEYRNFYISRYAFSEIYRNYYSYLNPLVYFFECIKNFYFCALTLETLINSENNKIKGAFIDHAMYTNGLMIEFLSQKKIPIYSLGYPKGIFAVKPLKNRNFR